MLLTKPGGASVLDTQHVVAPISQELVLGGTPSNP